MAPDEGNMHTLLMAGTPEQLETYLRPLAEGRTRSCFAMTEPDVASSDPTNLQTTAVRDGGEWVINGRKWCITGGDGAAFSIVVAKTGDDDAAGHRNYSLILVPTDTPGWEVVRHPEWLGSHSPGGHPEISLTDVRVPLGNLLGAEGEGFVIAQRRLAGGRLAHAMRWIGVAQRALDLTAERLLTRKAFGKELARHQALQFMVADSAMDLYASRLMVLHTAWKVEHGLPHRQEVAMTKTFVRRRSGGSSTGPCRSTARPGFAMDLPIAPLVRRRARRADLRRRQRGAPDGHRPRVPEARDAGALDGRGDRGPRLMAVDAGAGRRRPHARGGRGQRPRAAARPGGAAAVPRRARPRRRASPRSRPSATGTPTSPSR